MARGYVGRDLDALIQVDYEYQGHDFDSFDDMTNLFQMHFDFVTDTSNYKTDVEGIGNQAVEYARAFLRQNGTYNTGALHDSVRFEQSSSDGSRWALSAPARDKRGHLYAGHIEYGFTDKQGNSHGPWPFLRPAMRLAAADSRGELADTMAKLMLYGDADTGPGAWNAFRGGVISLGRTGNKATSSKVSSAVARTRSAYGSTHENKSWKSAYNGFNQRDSRNEWTLYTGDRDWDKGAL